MLLRLIVAVAVGVLWPAAAVRAGDPRPERIFVNGNIYTVDPARPRASAIAVGEDGTILAVGSDEHVRAMAFESRDRRTAVHDLGGRTVLPGLIDAHGHLSSLGMLRLGHMDLRLARSYEELVAEVKARAAQVPKGTWILGGRWDHESWDEKVLPTHEGLSAAVPDHPVWLSRVDGHAGLANALAMRLAGVTRQTPSPEGGEIIRDGRGEPTGVFVDNAEDLIARAVRGPEVSAAAVIAAAQEMCLSVGLAGVHDMGISPADAAAYREAAGEGRLKLRVYGVLAGPYAGRYLREHGPEVGERFTLRAIKLYADGAMGSRGAWLLEPYADRSADAQGRAYTGLAVTPVEMIEGLTALALERGWQVCTHAIGDRANREVLDVYERALGAASPEKSGDARLRVEHAQLLNPADIPRFARLGVIPSMQPTHCTSDMRWVEARVGPERMRGAYAWGSLLRTGARIAGGSDFPVESHNPFLGLYAAVTRQDLEGRPAGGWLPEERMTREEALRAVTIDAAWAGFEEGKRGSLEAGKWADFVVIDRDVMTCEVGEIPGTGVVMTVIGGEVVYRAAQSK